MTEMNDMSTQADMVSPNIKGKDEIIANLQKDVAWYSAMMEIRDMAVAKGEDRMRNLQGRYDYLEERVSKQDQALMEKDLAIEKLQKTVHTMCQADKKLAELQQQQHQLGTSTLALNAKLKKTKLVTAHSLAYITTEHREDVKEEMALASQRLREEQQSETTRYIAPHPTNVKSQQAPITDSQAKRVGQAWITHMVEVTDKLRKKYAIPVDKRRDMRSKKGKRPSIVPRYMASIWRLYLAPPPELVQVPDPRPVVNWGHINHNAVRNLPKPVLCPVKGVSQDPAMYKTKQKLNCFTNRTEIVESPFASKTAPFGKLQGLLTNHGIVCMPDIPVHGYVWSNEDANWIIAANTG